MNKNDFFIHNIEDESLSADLNQVEMTVDLDNLFKFSPRHKEVLLLYLDKHPIAYISEKLSISQTNIKRIINQYLKL